MPRLLPLVLLAGLTLGAPLRARAQDTAAARDTTARVPATPVMATATPDSAIARAQRLVRGGQGPAGRAVLDSLIAATPTNAPAYAEALYWRAALAATAADAERDYRRLAVEYPLSPRAEDALMRLAQLELARGDRKLAVQHLRRLRLEHPTSPDLAKAAYWEARMLFEDHDARGACAAVADGRARVAPGDAELRNQLDYLAKRCEGVDTTAAAPAAAPSSAPAAAPARPTPAHDSAREARHASAPATTAAHHAPAAPAAPPATGHPASAAHRAAAATRYAVQIASYARQASAEGLTGKLVKRGYPARVVHEGDAWKVRIGRYATRAEAASAERRLTKELELRGAWIVEERAP